ncbi:MAG: hypothetical protein Q4A34_00810 [Candidatus Saccharibacteria bacterium]|nr:hypothetical protein [Candidatus Saccharibacteria bacterium]
MKLPKKKSSENKNTHRLVIVSAVILLLASSSVYFLFKDALIKSPKNDIPADTSTPENSSRPNSTEAVNQGAITNEPDSKLRPVQNDQAKENHTTNNGQYTISVSTSSDSNVTSVFIRGMLGSSIDTGTCTASLRGPSGKTMSIQTPILPGPSVSSCKTIQLEKTNLAPGIWKYKLLFNSDNIKGVSDENSFEI